MPGKYYMGLDYRRDHSFRIPNPEMSEGLGTPNACTYCHADKTNKWATGYMDKWYGENRRLSYGAYIAQIDETDTSGFNKLVSISKDELFPPVMRAIALLRLSEQYPGKSNPALLSSFSDIESIIRFTAVQNFTVSSASEIDFLLPLLNDPVKAIRIEVASKLSAVHEQIPKESKKLFEQVRDEYIASMKYSADFAASRINLGNAYSYLGDTIEAIDQFKEAIRIDDEFFPAKVNLALLFNSLGENDKAELLLKDVVKKHPGQSAVKYSLGLLLAEMGKYEEAVDYLKMASLEMPNHVRAFYNLGQIEDFLGNIPEAENALLRAYQLEPDGQSVLIALIEFYLKQREFQKAKPLALKYLKTYPDDPSIQQVLDIIDSSAN
jgi:tetratricopeptide (TPR) repeat protein